MRSNVVRVSWLAIQRLGEPQQQLRQFALGLQLVRTWTVVPLLVASQLYLQTQIFDVQIVGTVLLFCCAARLFFRSPPLLVALTQQRGNQIRRASCRERV